jgi:hypothetical protein
MFDETPAEIPAVKTSPEFEKLLAEVRNLRNHVFELNRMLLPLYVEREERLHTERAERRMAQYRAEAEQRLAQYRAEIEPRRCDCSPGREGFLQRMHRGIRGSTL